VVIDAISKYYQEINANIHRGVHTLSQLATDAYEESRKKIQNHINAKFAHAIFTSGTTHGINAITNGFASILKAGDEILVSVRAPQQHCTLANASRENWRLRVIPMNENGELIMSTINYFLIKLKL
jgi:cysteine desulfurase/selenocysteine lyase